MAIREFQFDQDYEAVTQLWSNAGPGVKVSVSDSREELAKKLTRDPDLFLVAEADGQIVGTVIGGWDGRRGIIYHLAVANNHRHNGIGSALRREVEARLIAKGCRRAWLLVTQDNPEAISFYEKLGWGRGQVVMMGKYLALTPDPSPVRKSDERERGVRTPSNDK